MLAPDRSSAGRVMIVEDEMMVSMLLEDMLEELGYEPVGPAVQLAQAVAMAGDAEIDAAILDLNLNGQNTYPVADVLQRRAIPFVFATGYGAAVLAERFRGTTTLQKPFQRHELANALALLFAADGGAP